MRIHFKSILFKNILSYGNNLTEININTGLTALLGSNGNGKSVLLDALSFCLFGKPYRDIKIKELINRKNKKDLSVSCVFVVDDVNEYTLTRGISPDVLTIIQGGSELDLLSSKKLNQIEIDKILGINYDLFKQIISLSINQTKPFLTLKAQERRDLNEQIFNVKIVGEMVKYVKKENSDFKIKRDMVSRVVTIGESNIIELKSRIDDISDAKKDFERLKSADRKRHQDKIDANADEVYKLCKKTEKLQDQIDKLVIVKVDTLKEDIVSFEKDIKAETLRERTLEKEIAVLSSEINSKRKFIQNLNVYDICPTCNHSLTVEHKQAEIVSCETIVDIIQSKIELKEAECDLIRLRIANFEKDIKKKNAEINAQRLVDDEKRNLEYEIKSAESRVLDIRRETTNARQMIEDIDGREFNLNVDEITESYNKKVVELQSSKDELTLVTNELKTNEMILKVLSETGIKSFIFRKIVPVLNQAINKYLEFFGMPVTVNFDETMEETIRILGHHSDVSYASFSEGEKKRIDMAILLSFIKITKYLANWNCNLLIIDELLDSSVDEAGLEKLLMSLKTVALESKNQSIVIISHRQELVSHFNTIVKVEKSASGFSNVTVVGVDG